MKEGRVKREAQCPGCGKRVRIETSKDNQKMWFDCPQCGTPFTVTFETDEEKNRESYLLAKDMPG